MAIFSSPTSRCDPLGQRQSSRHRTTIQSRGNPFSDKKSVVIAQQRYLNAGISLSDVTIKVENSLVASPSRWNGTAAHTVVASINKHKGSATAITDGLSSSNYRFPKVFS
jgi:hypothetical protein